MEVLGIGYQEILLVFALVVIVVGPRRLPEMAYHLGRGVKKLQGYARVVRDEFSEEFTYLNEEMEAVRADVKEVRGSVREVGKELSEVRGEMKEAGSEVREAAAPAGEELKAIPAEAGASSANGAAPPRGIPGPGYMPPIATLDSQRRQDAPGVEPEAEAEAPPGKPLVF